MSVSLIHLARARELVMELLDELGLAAYRFEAEPREGAWRIVVECEVEGAWQTVNLTLPREFLERAQDEQGLRRSLRTELANSLAECRRRKQP